jgi:hypothetical protein
VQTAASDASRLKLVELVAAIIKWEVVNLGWREVGAATENGERKRTTEASRRITCGWVEVVVDGSIWERAGRRCRKVALLGGHASLKQRSGKRI